MSLRVLVVEDDREIRSRLLSSLGVEGFEVQTAVTVNEASALLEHSLPDLVLLDLGLPGVDGLEVMRTIRASGSTPIVVLTARDTELDTLLGLELGADDYMTKPFSPRELVARVRAVLRRGERAAEPGDRIEAGDLVLDVPRLRTTVADRAVDLTPTEFAILAAMAREPGRVFTRSQLLDAVHGVADFSKIEG